MKSDKNRKDIVWKTSCGQKIIGEYRQAVRKAACFLWRMKKNLYFMEQTSFKYVLLR